MTETTKTPEEIARAIAAQHFDTYQDSATEVEHPEGQPIVETWDDLRDAIEAAIHADRAQHAAVRTCATKFWGAEVAEREAEALRGAWAQHVRIEDAP